MTVPSLVMMGLLLISPAAARAEKADRDKPINVESDRLTYDDVKQITEFNGRVVLTKGTLVIRSDQMVLRQLPDNQQLATARGKPATLRQKRDGPGEQYVNGTGQTIDYDSRSEKMTLTGGAVLTRLECGRVMDTITGAVIVYDGRNETFQVDGGAGGPGGSTPKADGSGRVRVVIQAREGRGGDKGSGGEARSTPPPCPPGEATRLRPEPGIAAPRPDTAPEN